MAENMRSPRSAPVCVCSDTEKSSPSSTRVGWRVVGVHHNSMSLTEERRAVSRVRRNNSICDCGGLLRARDGQKTGFHAPGDGRFSENKQYRFFLNNTAWRVRAGRSRFHSKTLISNRAGLSWQSRVVPSGGTNWSLFVRYRQAQIFVSTLKRVPRLPLTGYPHNRSPAGKYAGR